MLKLKPTFSDCKKYSFRSICLLREATPRGCSAYLTDRTRDGLAPSSVPPVRGRGATPAVCSHRSSQECYGSILRQYTPAVSSHSGSILRQYATPAVRARAIRMLSGSAAVGILPPPSRFFSIRFGREAVLKLDLCKKYIWRPDPVTRLLLDLRTFDDQKDLPRWWNIWESALP